MLSLCHVVWWEVKKQSRRIIRDPLNVHVGKEKNKQTGWKRSWKGALVGVGRIKSVNSTSQKTLCIFKCLLTTFLIGSLFRGQQLHPDKAVQPCRAVPWHMTSYSAISNQYFECFQVTNADCCTYFHVWLYSSAVWLWCERGTRLNICINTCSSLLWINGHN